MSLISQTTIDQVRDLPLEQVIGKYASLKKKGVSWWSPCPFHDEKTASFSVTPAKGIYKCFGCGKGGNTPIKFVMEKENLSFPEAVKELAGQHGIVVEYDSTEKAAENEKKHAEEELQVEVNTLARDLFLEEMGKLDMNLQRWDSETMALWDIGFAPDDWNTLHNRLKETPHLKQGLELGLLKEKNGKTYDGFRNRLMFPIYDHRKRLVGYTGRYLGEDSKAIPKYLNSPESDLYNKGKLLYGMHLAIDTIRDKGCAVLVEGTSDVISLHRTGTTNAVAPCGTALTIDQLKLLSRYCKHLMLMYDGDAAGQKAMHKNATLAIEQGFSVSIIQLQATEDPDSFFSDRLLFPTDTDSSQTDMLEGCDQDYILYLTTMLPADIRLRSKALDNICKLLAYNNNELERATMTEEVVILSKEKVRKLTKAINDHRRLLERQNPENVFFSNTHIESQYTMPDGVGCRWNEVKEDVLKYLYFTDNNRIFMRRGDDGNYTFKQVSNFSISIIQHMEDEKLPTRLVQIINVHGRKRTFDTSTDDFVTELGFKKMIEGRGNFTWGGQSTDFVRLNTKLKDDMGDGRMISILGHQPEGFWAFNNAVIIDGQPLYLDEYGCFDHDGESYYIPSGNKIYERNVAKFFPQKKAMYIKSKYSFHEVADQIIRVHRHHAYNALLFTVATCFSDLIYDRTSFFPIMFLYGEAGSGKDNLIEACQSFFGQPQTPITITGKANTDKAKIRKFAQFNNMVGHMTEYVPGNDDTDQMIKSFWDRVGYERGTIDSAVGTESIQITMSIFFTGNDYAVNDALITRFIGEEMNQSEFNQDAKNEYEKGKEMTHAGYSGLMVDIISHREAFEKDFRKEFKDVGCELAEKFARLNIADRMIQNAAVLGAVYKITHAKLNYPFTWEQFKENMLDVYKRQSNKRSTGSVVAHWWECVIAAIKDKNSPIREHREFSISASELTIQFSSVYAKYLEKHYSIFREKGLSKSVLMDKLRKSDSFQEAKKSHRFGEARSSGMVFDLDKTGIKDQLLEALNYVASEGSIANRNGYTSESSGASSYDLDRRIESYVPLKVVTNDKQQDLPD